MNRQTTEIDDTEDDDFDDSEEVSEGEDAATDNVGDASVEINVDDLISEVEAAGLPTDHFKSMSARRRLDEILEERRIAREMSDFDDFDLD